MKSNVIAFPGAGHKISKRDKATKAVLTAERIESIPIPSSGKHERVYDSRFPGLLIQVCPGGKRTYFLARRRFGQGAWLRIGTYPELTPSDARAAAAELLARIERGEPIENLEEQNSSVYSLFLQYHEQHCKPHTRSPADSERFYHWYLHSKWGNLSVNSISRLDVQKWVNELGAKCGYATGNKALAQLSAILNWSDRQGLVKLYRNPTKGIEKFKTRARERYLQPGAEINKFLDAVDKLATRDMADFVKLSLLTGVRKGNVQAMRWEDLDLENGTWSIQITKNGSSFTTVLVPAAREILARRRALIAPGCLWVFPSKSASGHMTSPRSSFNRICAKAGISDLHIHDLRRTVGSHLAIAGFSLPQIGRVLGHTDSRSTMVYARLNLKPVREGLGVMEDILKQRGVDS